MAGMLFLEFQQKYNRSCKHSDWRNLKSRILKTEQNSVVTVEEAQKNYWI